MSFNGATARRPWRTAWAWRRTRHGLQWGHGTKAVENVKVLHVTRARSGFNGATARRPWRTPLDRRPGCDGFNGATARRPWRTSQQLAMRTASMGPRHEGRGERLVAGEHDRSFNGATARRPWRTQTAGRGPQRVQPASMGPRHEGRGERSTATYPGLAGFNGATARRPWRTQVGLVDARRRGAASMGPRHEGRGEQQAVAKGLVVSDDLSQLQWGHGTKAVENVTAGDEALSHAASMGPRHEGRGEPGRRCGFQAFRLQWGHGTKAVENLGNLSQFNQRLQWGHGTKAVENQPRSETWMNAELQWGHGTKAVENQREVAADERRAASMGPRHEGRGERQRDSEPSNRNRLRFNGATARRPWRTARTLRLAIQGFNGATARRPWRTSE